MENLIKQAVYSIPKLNLEEYAKLNGTSIDKLYDSLDYLEDDNLRQLFLNRYPLKSKKTDVREISGENVLKQILKIKHIKLNEIADTYDTTKRQLLRIMKRVEKRSPELYEIYKKFRSGQLTKEDEEYIENMPIEDIETIQNGQALPKILTAKTHETVVSFKTEEKIREEIYNKIANKCEDPEELEEKINHPDTERIVQNRWKKEKVMMEYFETECGRNYELLYIALGNKNTINMLKEKFAQIDEEDGMIEIYMRRYKERGE